MLVRRVEGTTRWTVLGVAILMLSACGSTVQWSDTVAQGGLGEGPTADGLSLVEPGKDDAAEASSARGPHGNRPRTSAAGESTVSTDRPAAVLGPTDRHRSTASRPRNGRGFSQTEIYIGYATWKDREAAWKAAGESAEFGDQEAIAKAIVNDINDRGGIADRKVLLAFHDFKTQEIYANPNGAFQAACATWTEDRPVLAVVNVLGSIEAGEACLAKRKTPQVVQANVLIPQSRFSRYDPYLFAPSHSSVERLIPAWMKRAEATGYFDGGWDIDPARPGAEPTRIGILSTRTTNGPSFTRAVREELVRRQQMVAATFERTGQVSTLSNEMHEAVVRFRQAGVTHVVTSGEGNELWFFTVAADSQNYRPRYLVSSIHAPGDLLQSSAPTGQLTGALGVGWSPSLDVDNANDPGDVSAQETRCRQIMQKAGQSTSNRQAFARMVSSCDGFEFLVSAIERGGLLPEGVGQGAAEMGSMKSAATFRISFRGNTGAAIIRDLVYHENCNCFGYLSGKNHAM